MRIIQIIDSLEAGGAERMAVNYANALVPHVDFSGLVTTRKEGPLLSQLHKRVDYLFLNKRNSFDLKALLLLRRFVVKHRVTLVHAHSTSFFIAFLLKLVCPSVKLIWHDHFGESEFLKTRATLMFKITLPFFNGVISVNQKLKYWSERKIGFKNTIYLPNFASQEMDAKVITVLNGFEGKRILSLANLRSQKNHFLLLRVAKRLKESHPDWTFHLIGKDFEDDYSAIIKNLVVDYDLKETVFVYGSKNDIQNIVEQSDICILTSKSEGLPVALLEYGRGKKPVVVTDVGEIPTVIQDGNTGFIVPQKEELFYAALVRLIENEVLRGDFGEAIYNAVLNNYSEQEVLKEYLKWLQKYNK
jgi:glycosyltransferase involved in cell wall biosynthesis